MEDGGSKQNTSESTLIISLVCVLAAYLLAPGPLVYMIEKKLIMDDGPAMKVIEVVYFPLEFVTERVRPVQRLYEKYLKLWGA